MLEKTPQEFHCIENHGAPSVTSAFLVAEEDLTALHFHDAAVGNSDLENIGGQVFDAPATVADCLAIYIPAERPSIRGYILEESRFFHLILELRLEYF